MQDKLKILIAASQDVPAVPGPFQIKFGGEFAARKFIPHITDGRGRQNFCSKRCLEYRRRYRLDFSDRIAGIMHFPAVLPEVVDEADLYLKEELPKHDVLIAIGVHPDILMELMKRAAAAGCGAIIIPREDPVWLDSSLLKKIREICESKNMEYAFPRPFCSLVRGHYRLINDFIEQFRIGRPEYRLILDKDEKVCDVRMIRSSPCGATYHVASGLIGLRKKEVAEAANRLWHMYPCLSSSRMDPEIKDSPMHMAAYINLAAAKEAVKNAIKG